MQDNIEVLTHSSIRITRNKVIYIDPYQIVGNPKDADIIFITHDHFDHYSEEDISKIRKDNTSIIIPQSLLDNVLMFGFEKDHVVVVAPNQSYHVQEITFETIPAYNVNKMFHPKENNWVGYIINIDDARIYVAGDTDITEENKKVKCDVAFVPVGGTYTMNYQEAAELINEIMPKYAIPIHYGSIVGAKEDAEKFIKLLKPEIKGSILMK